MDSGKVDMFMLCKGYLFPNAQLPLLREMLITSEEDWGTINSVPFKNPTTVLILSIAAGTYGADRFYLGHHLLGVGKLLLTILFIAWIIVMEIWKLDDWFFVGSGLVLTFVLLFWYFIDIFLVSTTARAQNLNTILTILK
ncbi:MAG: TM2 domain-containing protein [Bacteroidaceae bacterium]|nr:TM2 domain-containing protein [Bacteroidaceae bacterium]